VPIPPVAGRCRCEDEDGNDLRGSRVVRRIERFLLDQASLGRAPDLGSGLGSEPLSLPKPSGTVPKPCLTQPISQRHNFGVLALDCGHGC